MNVLRAFVWACLVTSPLAIGFGCLIFALLGYRWTMWLVWGSIYATGVWVGAGIGMLLGVALGRLFGWDR